MSERIIKEKSEELGQELQRLMMSKASDFKTSLSLGNQVEDMDIIVPSLVDILIKTAVAMCGAHPDINEIPGFIAMAANAYIQEFHGDRPEYKGVQLFAGILAEDPEAPQPDVEDVVH